MSAAATAVPMDSASLLKGDEKPAPAGADKAKAANGSSSPDAGNDNWRSQFAEGLDETVAKDWNTWSGRYQSPQEFAKGYVELRKSAVILPGADAKPDAWNAVYDRLGRPKDAKEYKFSDPADLPLDDADKELREGFRPVAHRIGLTQKQLNELEGWQYQTSKVQRDAFEARASRASETNIKTLKADWGPDFDRNITHYNRALKAYAGQDYQAFANKRLADGTFLGDDPAFVRMMSKIGSERAEDERFGEVFNPEGLADAKAKIDQIEAEAAAKGLNPTHPLWPHAQLKPLYARAHGTRSVRPGVIGR